MEWAWFSFSKAQLTIRGTITEWILQVYPWPSSLNEKQGLRTNLVVPCVCRWYSNGILKKGRDWKRFISTSKRVHPHHCTWHLLFPTDECQGWHGKGHQGQKMHQNSGVEVQLGDNKENEDTSSHSSIGKQPQGVYSPNSSIKAVLAQSSMRPHVATPNYVWHRNQLHNDAMVRTVEHILKYVERLTLVVWVDIHHWRMHNLMACKEAYHHISLNGRGRTHDR